MKTKKTILWVTRTAMFIALVLIAQALSASAGQYVTGSIVNFITILAVLLCGLSSGITVAAVTPLFAFFLGIGPKLPVIIPCIVLGNVVLVLVWYFIAGKTNKVFPRYILGAIIAAVAKFLFLYLSIVQFVIGVLNLVPEQQAGVVSVMFSVPQLVTALIGGGVAIIVAPILKKALKLEKNNK